MKKHFTYRNAMIGECAGFALFAASFFVPSHSLADILLYGIGTILIWAGVITYFHERGYNKGRTEALKVEITRVWSQQEPFVASDEAPMQKPRTTLFTSRGYDMRLDK